MAKSDGRITFSKILNFRDVGQHINAITGSKTLKPGLVYRSARPDEATPSDRHRLLNDLKIKTIIDLRTPTEHLEQTRKHAGDVPSSPALAPNDPAQALRIPEIEYKDINLNGSAYSNALVWQLSYFQIARLFGLYMFGYRKEAIGVLATNVMAERGLPGLAIDTLTHSRLEMKEVFSNLCDEASHPVLIHCTQGKDRTGLVVLLVLLLCGVAQDVIKHDYRLSESELAPERHEKLEEIRSIGLPDSFADCPEEWTSVVCSHFKQTFGGVERYLEDCGVGLDEQKALKALLVAP